MKRIQIEFKKTSNLVSSESLFDKVELVDNNLRIWKIVINVPEGNFLNEFKKKTKETKIEFEIRFPEEEPNAYPSVPPQPRIVYPRFSSTFSTLNGGMCMEILGNNGWTVTTSVETFMVSIVDILINGSVINGITYDSVIKNYQKGRNTDYKLANYDTETFMNVHKWNNFEEVKITNS